MLDLADEVVIGNWDGLGNFTPGGAPINAVRVVAGEHRGARRHAPRAEVRPVKPGSGLRERVEARVPRGEQTRLPAHSLVLFRSPSRALRRGGAVHTFGATYRLQLTKDFGFDAPVKRATARPQ